MTDIVGFGGKKLSEHVVLTTISSVLLNEKLAEYERLLHVTLLLEEFTMRESKK